MNLLANLNLLSESTDPVERLRHDEKVLALVPAHPQARQALEELAKVKG